MRVALHNAIKLQSGDAAGVIRECALSAGFDSVEFVPFSSAIDLADATTTKASPPLDLAVLPYALPGCSGIQAVEEAKTAQAGLKAIIVDDEPLHALEASRASVDGYLVEPLEASDFRHILERVVASLRDSYDSSVLLNSRNGAVRVALDDIVYCETSGHDQVLHLRKKPILAARCSSLALFELLSSSSRFFKVGSSYIVNLHEVIRFHAPSGDLALADGTAIPVPQRLRKSLEDALLSQP